MAKGRRIYLTDSEFRFVATALDLARGCGELEDQLPHHDEPVSIDKILKKFGIYLPEDAE